MESQADVAKNTKKSLELLGEAIKDNPDLIIFPEYQMVLPDYGDIEDTGRKFEPETGRFVSTFTEFSSDNAVSLMINYGELSGGRRFNTSLLIVDGSIVMKYSKTHLFDAYNFRESSIYEHGESVPSPYLLNGFRIAPMICYDIRFAELARMYEERGADILVYQSGWYSGENKLDLWSALLRARATETGTYSVGAAQCGPAFTGHTAAFSPYGNSLGELGEREGHLTFTVDSKILENYRRDVPLASQRRSDLYRFTY